jgi:hypothetical protein
LQGYDSVDVVHASTFYYAFCSCVIPDLSLNQDKLDRAQEIFGVTTDTEAIALALDATNDLALFRAEVDTGFKNLLGKGRFTDYFPALNKT